jgi:hypothetical protein
MIAGRLKAFGPKQQVMQRMTAQGQPMPTQGQMPAQGQQPSPDVRAPDKREVRAAEKREDAQRTIEQTA